LSGQFLQRILFVAVDAIPGVFSCHTHTEMLCASQNTGKLLVVAKKNVFLVPCFAYKIQHSLDLSRLPKWPVFSQNASGNPDIAINNGGVSIFS